ncbi:MAG TPA: XRE family transcriptional regulator [Acidimicrobiales bacterium]|nr:XRE family transcriptional regulator [Acidimicrobiales bacterium]
MSDDLGSVLRAVGPRLRALRHEAGVTLAELAATTGISVSTLSRLESGARRPTLELLLPLAQAHQVPLDELVGAPAVGDPRIDPEPFTHHGSTFVPLTRQAGGIKAFKQIMPVGVGTGPLELQVHEGYEWLYVLSGRLRLVLADRELVLEPGEAAEFDTRVPHGIGNAGSTPVEILNLFGVQGERVHVRAAPADRRPGRPARPAG